VSRSLSSVILDESVKQRLLQDIRDYQQPSTQNWYSNRGIPYRRGYLLHGPPGTGKSSFSFAVAGYFLLDIYILNLNTANMSKGKLESLFSRLPAECIVLLEDIDSAGLTKNRKLGFGI
jgi:chaperone BCS1